MPGQSAKIRLSRAERRLRSALEELSDSLPRDSSQLDKDRIRTLHQQQRLARLAELNGSFDRSLDELRSNLARPAQVSVDAIAPRLVPVLPRTPEATLFAAATLTWSIPVSRGFGRRLRFLVRDDANGKLIGIIGLTDPVFNLRPRDAWVGWSAAHREERLVNVMDAFVLGALPPYSHLLGGKLIALLAASREVVKAFRAKYAGYKGVISEREKNPHLVLLTTTSALGRSSVYNRLQIPGSVRYLTNVETDTVPDWYTQGYGHFQIGDGLFQQAQQVLVRREHPYASGNRFGDGPNWRMRVIRQAAKELGIGAALLKHGVRRQVYVVPLAENTREFLCGKGKRPRHWVLGVEEITHFWRERWAKPRAERCKDWVDWSPDALLDKLTLMRRTAVGGED